jgi:hypothetical protein
MKSSIYLSIFILVCLYINSSCSFISQNKTIALSSIDSTKQTFKDYNQIISFFEHDSILFAVTANGVLSYNELEDKWSISKSDSNYLHKTTQVKALLTEDELPDNYEKSTYTEIIKQHNDWLLISHGNEEKGYKQEVVNTSEKRIYRFPYECIWDFIVKDETIWIGSGFGISRINTNTLERVDYRMLPSFKEIRNTFEFADKIYYLDYEYGLFVYDKQSKQVSPIVEINKFAYENNIKFNNSILINNTIYIAVTRMEKCIPYLAGNACVLTFNLESNLSNKIETELQYFDSFLHKDSYLYCYGEYQQFFEGGDYTFYGGVVGLNLENGQLNMLSNTPIVSLTERQNGLDALSIIDYEYYNFLVTKKESFYIDSLNRFSSRVEFIDTTYCKFQQGVKDYDTIFLVNDALHKSPRIIHNSHYSTQAQLYSKLKAEKFIKKDTILTNLMTKITMIKINRNRIEVDKY